MNLEKSQKIQETYGKKNSFNLISLFRELRENITSTRQEQNIM